MSKLARFLRRDGLDLLATGLFDERSGRTLLDHGVVDEGGLKTKRLKRAPAARLRERVLEVLSSTHDFSACRAVLNRPFSTRPFGGPFLGGSHSTASAFLCHWIDLSFLMLLIYRHAF